MLLALDTTSPPGSAALLLPDGRCVTVAGDARPFGEQLPGTLHDLVSRHGHRLGEIDVFAVTVGPGSLTGLRVGIATVQGLAFASGRPCVGVSIFDALAWAWLVGAAPRGGDLLGLWLDARRDEVFTALLRRTGRAIDDDAAVGELVDLVDAPGVGAAEERLEGWRKLVSPGSTLSCCGTRVLADRAALASLAPEVSFVDVPTVLASAVAEVAQREVRHGRTVRPHALHPLYVRRPDVEVARDRAHLVTDK